MIKKLLILFTLLFSTGVLRADAPKEYASEYDFQDLTLEELTTNVRGLASLYNRNLTDIYAALSFSTGNVTVNKFQNAITKNVTQDIQNLIIQKNYINRLGGFEFGDDNSYLSGVLFRGDGTIYSQNFVSGSDGWQIEGNGDAEFANSVFRGTITALGGEIADFDIFGSSIVSNNPAYVSGVTGEGVLISPDLIEAGNIACRGILRSATFQKDTISAVGGNFMVAAAGVLKEDVTSLDASGAYDFIFEEDLFNINEIIRIKDGVDDEWIHIAGDLNNGTYAVVRDKKGDYAVDNNPAWKKGATAVSYGNTTSGGTIFMTASETNAPYIEISTHTGSPWSSQNKKVRIGKLDGVTSDVFGALSGFGIWTDNGYYEGTVNIVDSGSLVYAAPQTRLLMIKPSSFIAQYSTQTTNNGLIIKPLQSGTTVNIYAPLDMPIGATYAELSLAWYRQAGSASTCKIIKGQSNATGATVATIDSASVSTGYLTADTTSFSENTVSLLPFNYFVQVSLYDDDDPTDVGLVFVGMEYTVTEPLP